MKRNKNTIALQSANQGNIYIIYVPHIEHLKG
jgi:hypothetical protein